ncbi:ABC transporter ATP-binding protein [Roseomonas stagni]|uniref:ABC transporter ATP-binding protein n=1 Tax=Falsiroseomonas algicola TaxID=2716930 RepID=A0A6M1LRF2_9PROT|nr:ABC transporter ATP-binding protein [Falsiroseomonas algicola]NGM23015.1 ABC transporter ATP-binding protein [Falsiroseomonas algicola]
MRLLEVEDLHVEFAARGLDNRVRVARALNGVSFTVDAGEVVGLVGETGAGKSLTALAAMGLLRAPARIPQGSIRFEGQDILAMSDRELEKIRGRRMAMVVQSPLTSLDPLKRIGDQLVRMQRVHGTARGAEARARAEAMLAAVRIPDPARRMQAWPHELSGGMAQRVLIAMALVNEPALVIADEPTTGLDVTVQAQVLDTLRDLVRARNLGALVITHDLGVVAHYCQRVAVMFAGRIVEDGPVAEVFARPAHPYTQALIASTPGRIAQLGYTVTGGTPPDLYDLPSGCLYRDRCPRATTACLAPPPRIALDATHGAACHYAWEAA